jgi:hypothetical protein
MTPQDAIWKVLADIQAQSANEPQPDFRVEAELPSATAIMADAAARDPFRLDKIVAFDKPTQPKVDWKMAAMLAADAERRIATMPAPTIGPTAGGRALPSGLPNPLAGIPMQVQRDNPLAGLAMPGVQREPISMGWRTPQAMAARATAGAREQFDAQTPIANTAIRMAGPMLGGAIGAVGGPVGMAAGAAMGGTLASQWAQSRETAQGTRAGVNPLVMAAEGYANLLPVMMPEAGAALAPQLPKVLGSALGGAAVSDAAIQMAETGRIDPAALAMNTLVGGAIGGGAAVGAHALARGAQSDAVARLVDDETGAVGPNIREALPQQPEANPGGETVTRFQKLPASERGVLDPLTPERGAQVSPGAQVPVPESITPSGLTAAERRADDIRIDAAIRRHNVTGDEEELVRQIHREGRDRNFEQHRGMHTSWAQTDAEASIIVPEVKLTKGTTLNAADLTALRRTAHGVASQTVELSDDLTLAKGLQTRAAAGDAAAQADLDAILAKHRARSVPELILAREESFLKTQVAIKSLAGVKSELGRALNTLKSFQQKRNMGDAEFLQAVIERGGSGREAVDALSAMRNADGSINREAQFRYLRGLSKPGAQDYWHWYARTAYLSSMATQWRNFSGNAANFGIEALAVRPVAAVIDAKNTNRSVTLSEMRAMGTTSGFLDGLHKASFFFKNGFTKEDVDALESLPPEVFDGKLFPNVIARTMGAVDQFFRTVGFHVELHRMAITEAHKEGLRGDAMLARAKALVDDPTITPDLVSRAEKYARGLTFQDKGTAATRAAHQTMKAIDGATKGLADAAWDAGLSKYGKVGSATYGLLSFPPSVIIAPFINTPFNILKRAGQYTPAGLVASKFTKDPRDSAMMAARGAVGTAMMGAAVGLWMNDRITGKPPQYGTPEWETFYATKKPYSIKVGDQWVPYSYLGPVGMVLGATANYADAVSRDPRNVLGYFGKLVGQVGRTAIDASFLRGMQSILMAVADDSPEQRSMQKLANSTVTGLLPLAGLQRDIRNVVDPTLRDPVTSTDMKGFEPQTLRDELSMSLAPIKEQVMGGIPGLSQKLEPRLDRTGEEIQRGSTVWPESRPSDPVREELLRLNGETKGGYYRDPVEAGASLLGKINTEIKRRNREDKGNRPLLASVPRPLITAYAKRYGELSEKRMTWLTGKSWYAEASDDRKRRWVDKVKRDTAEQVDTEFKRRYLQQSTRKR